MFCEKSYSYNSQPTQYQKNKIDKDNFEKNHNKKKPLWGNTVAIHRVLKKKTTKLNSQPFNIKKIKSIKIILKKIIKKNTKIIHLGKHCSNPQCFMRKNIVVIFN